LSRNSQPAQRLRVFLCHSSSDKPAVRKLYRQLNEDGFQPWLDEEDLLAGQKWQSAIKRAVRNADAVIVCLSRKATTKAGFLQKEIKFVLDVADEQPEDSIFVIPLKLEECEVPRRMDEWHWISFFDERGYERLLRALRHRAGELKRAAEADHAPPPSGARGAEDTADNVLDLGLTGVEITTGSPGRQERFFDSDDILGLESLFAGLAKEPSKGEEKRQDDAVTQGARGVKPKGKPEAPRDERGAGEVVARHGSGRCAHAQAVGLRRVPACKK
jgi:hypothetical protein